MELELIPCEQNCFKYPGDVGYDQDIMDLLSIYMHYIKFIDSTSTLEVYDEPLGLAVGATYELLLTPVQEITKRISLEQVVVRS